MKIYEVSYECDSAGTGYKHIFCPTMKIAKAVKKELCSRLTETAHEYDSMNAEFVETGEVPISPQSIRIRPVEFTTQGGMKAAACRIAYRTTDALDLDLPWWKYVENQDPPVTFG